MKKPIFVAISDVHFTLNTLSLATEAFRHAIDKAAELGVPLIDCGDLTNDKAILRAEVVSRLIELEKYAGSKKVDISFLVGNHSLLNEKVPGVHALSFLKNVISEPCWYHLFGACQDTVVRFIPYQSDSEVIRKLISKITKKTIIVMHQGVKGAFMGDYLQDKSSIEPEVFEGHIVFSGHYHRHQSIGPVTYIGNPYSLTFGEANDGPKGYLVVYDDGSFERVLLPFRKHVIVNVDCTKTDLFKIDKHQYNLDDLIWLKVTGPRSYLATLNKKEIGKHLFGHENFKLDKIPSDAIEFKPINKKLTENEILDQLIDNLAENTNKKEQLKKLWKEVLA
jgi:UDP-2,3-diacylglucosamine pyrophosphatase LpxH